MIAMMENRTYIAVPTGATVREQLDDRGMTQKEFAAHMDMSQKHVSRLINGEVQLTPDTARKLELVLGVPASFWSNLEARYRDQLAKAAAENEMDEDIDRFEAAGSFTKRDVLRFSQEVGIAPGIVVGRLQNDRLLRYDQLGGLKEKYELAN